MKKAIIYIHGKGGSSAEAEHYKAICQGFDVYGLDYKGNTPWDTIEEFQEEYDALALKYDEIVIIANSIGAFFAMNALKDRKIKKALFISPIVNMEKLICDMMLWANVTEAELQEKGEIQTNFGEVLSWEYLSYVREHPITWNVPTEILYASDDNLTSRETVTEFAEAHGMGLTVMENGEHWFHTEEQMVFLDKRVDRVINKSDNDKHTYGLPIGMCLGLSIGTAIGAATQNYGLWMPMGIALGMLWGTVIDNNMKLRSKNGTDKTYS